MMTSFVILDAAGGASQVRRLPIGDTAGHGETWLRDRLFDHPEILPLDEIDDAFGPLIPLCRELRTEAGPADILYVNPRGRLTLVECKLWRNPEARRKVVAQLLDYAAAMAEWSYSDLQRQVAAATGASGNVPFHAVVAAGHQIDEHTFVDAVARNLRSGRILSLVVGDGIREDVHALTSLVNRNVASAVSIGLVEVALYDFGEGRIGLQPRVLARTQVIEREVVLLRSVDAAEPSLSEYGMAGRRQGAYFGPRDEASLWFDPLIGKSFYDPDQEPLSYRGNSSASSDLPYPGTWITAFRTRDEIGVFLGGHADQLEDLMKLLKPDMDELLRQLPEGASLRPRGNSGVVSLDWRMKRAEFKSEHAQRECLWEAANAFVFILRPAVSVHGSKGWRVLPP
jgi:hypothetical protein